MYITNISEQNLKVNIVKKYASGDLRVWNGFSGSYNLKKTCCPYGKWWEI